MTTPILGVTGLTMAGLEVDPFLGLWVVRRGDIGPRGLSRDEVLGRLLLEWASPTEETEEPLVLLRFGESPPVPLRLGALEVLPGGGKSMDPVGWVGPGGGARMPMAGTVLFSREVSSLGFLSNKSLSFIIPRSIDLFC